ncbi:MAG: hypothetical protein WDO16_13415 [Bacteroidota bacterium]
MNTTYAWTRTVIAGIESETSGTGTGNITEMLHNTTADENRCYLYHYTYREWLQHAFSQ